MHHASSALAAVLPSDELAQDGRSFSSQSHVMSLSDRVASWLRKVLQSSHLQDQDAIHLTQMLGWKSQVSSNLGVKLKKDAVR